MRLAELVRESHDYLDRFEYDEYTERFPVFRKKFEEIILNNDERDPMQLIKDLGGKMSGASRREQRDLVYKDKQVLALYLTPAALDIGGEAAIFAEELCRAWSANYPKEKYSPGTYEVILKGFDSNLLGLPIRKSNKWKRKKEQ